MDGERAPPKIVVFGIAFWFPLAGVTYQTLQYLIGLRRLGYDPYYVEDQGRWVYDFRIGTLSPDASANVAAVAPAFEAHGFAGRWAYRGAFEGGRCHGMGGEQIDRLYREAAALLNVTGAQEMREEHLVCPRRVYVETDPVISQVHLANGDPQFVRDLSAHDTHFSFGENLGAPDCGVPIVRFRWLPTRQPVVLDLWDGGAGPGTAYTTIATWHNPGRDVVWRGETYRWTKDEEFAKFIDLPRRRGIRFELATHIADERVRRSYAERGWHFVDPLSVSADVPRYRDFVCGSRAEFTVAKDANVRLRSGWFSDRSACYLAAGRPVITQDTAFDARLPTGRGLHSFRTPDDALAAIDAVETDYEGNRRAAREIAHEYFAAEKVLGDLMRRAGLDA